MRMGCCSQVLVFAAAATACNMELSSPGGGGVSVDESAIMSALSGHRESPAFVRLNDAPYATALGTGASINVYVSANGYVPYASITPDKTGSGAILPEGTLILREVLEPNGAIKTLTLMYKGPKGYNPDLGDFWFGVTDVAGKPALDTNNVAKLGRLAECYSCHTPRANDGYLFGVPASVRPQVATPTPTPPPVTPLPPPPPPTQQPVCGDFVCNGNESCAVCAYDCGRCPEPGDDDDDDDGDDGGGDGHGGGHG
jgi:hypothetical protein